MKRYFVLGLAVLAGVAIGAAGVNVLQAQTKPVIYVAEIDVHNVDGYVKEFVPKTRATVAAMGGKFIAVGSKITTLEGAVPKQNRVVIQEWPNMEKLKAWWNSSENKANHEIGKKYATFNTFAFEQ